MTLTILKIIAVVVILAAMFVILIGIGHLLSGKFDTNAAEIDELRKDVEQRSSVISDNNSFHDFLAKSDSTSGTHK